MPDIFDRASQWLAVEHMEAHNKGDHDKQRITDFLNSVLEAHEDKSSEDLDKSAETIQVKSGLAHVRDDWYVSSKRVLCAYDRCHYSWCDLSSTHAWDSAIANGWRLVWDDGSSDLYCPHKHTAMGEPIESDDE